MISPERHRLSTIAALLLFCCTACAHAQDTIYANPNAVRLRELWRIEGPNEGGGDRLGDGIGSVGDINNDGLGDFAVHWGKLDEWRIYLGQSPTPDTSAVWRLDSAGGVRPLIGDFWGTGRQAVVFPTAERETVGGHTKFFQKLWFFRTENNTLGDQPDLILNYRHSVPSTTFSFSVMNAVDLDKDGADELVLFNYEVNRGEWDRHAEIWIYRGGPDFQVDSPTLIIRDPYENFGDGTFYAGIGDLDGDSKLDMVVSVGNTDAGRLKFWWGRDGSPWNWGAEADRVVYMEGDAPRGLLYLLDCDGDGIKDLMTNSPTGPRLYRSGGGRSMRTRSLLGDDADRHLRTMGGGSFFPMGPLNDTAGGYDMIGRAGGPRTLIAFSGGPNGPDSAYDASYSDSFGDLFGIPTPLPDINGDGWPEIMFANYTYFFESGVAVILSGGPYIPRDGIAGVEEVAIDDVASALSIWPQPAGEELNIAWRGDLRRMPARFEVHDLLGRLVAVGDVPPSAGAAVWRCSSASPGIYLLTVYDQLGTRISTLRILKE